MSGLLEEVARAILMTEHQSAFPDETVSDRNETLDSIERDWALFSEHARAAIKTVAEWIVEDCETVFNGGGADVLAVSDDLMKALAARLLKQLEVQQ